MNALLDFAYGVSVRETLRNDVSLACDVLLLADRFGVKELKGAAADLACSQATVENCIGLYHLLKLCKCARAKTMILFIVRWLDSVGKSPNFKTICIEDLELFVRSKEAVAEEIHLFEIIRDWLKHNKFSGNERICNLFSAVHFELLTPDERRTVQSEPGLVPEKELFSSLENASGAVNMVRGGEVWDGVLVKYSEILGTAGFSGRCIRISYKWLFESYVTLSGQGTEALTFNLRFVRRTRAEALSSKQKENLRRYGGQQLSDAQKELSGCQPFVFRSLLQTRI